MSAMELDRSAIDQHVGALSALIALPIDPAYRASVAEHLGRLLTMAALLDGLPLSDDIEAAPVFHP